LEECYEGEAEIMSATRDEFEKWVLSLKGDFEAHDLAQRNEFNSDRYSNDSLQFAWAAWRAANPWQPIETAPKNQEVWVAFHGHGESRVQVATLTDTVQGRHGGWDYINSHDGDPQYWMPISTPAPPDGMKGPHCNCDVCIEEYSQADGEPSG
jgi:hypothetical protein